MIKSNELRIGNSILQDGELVFVTSWRLRLIELDSVVYKPIPLTEEWLIKLGFKNIDTNENGGDNYWYLSKTDFMLDRSYQHLHTNTGLQLYSVHQLQNLYFALTGEELTIKENE